MFTTTTLEYASAELTRRYLAHELGYDAYVAALEDVKLCEMRLASQTRVPMQRSR